MITIVGVASSLALLLLAISIATMLAFVYGGTESETNVAPSPNI